MLCTFDPDRPTPDSVMRGMFEARKSVFIDLLGWDLPVLAGRYEIDHFDDVHARYLICTDGEKVHRASARLLPTSRPHLLDTHFADLCEEAPPCGPAIFEISRFCLDRNQGAAERREARDALVTGLVDYALQTGISAYTGVAEPGWLRQILGFGWRCGQLGPLRRARGMILGALRIDITPETPALLAQAGVIRRGHARAEAA